MNHTCPLPLVAQQPVPRAEQRRAQRLRCGPGAATEQAGRMQFERVRATVERVRRCATHRSPPCARHPAAPRALTSSARDRLQTQTGSCSQPAYAARSRRRGQAVGGWRVAGEYRRTIPACRLPLLWRLGSAHLLLEGGHRGRLCIFFFFNLPRDLDLVGLSGGVGPHGHGEQQPAGRPKRLWSAVL